MAQSVTSGKNLILRVVGIVLNLIILILVASKANFAQAWGFFLGMALLLLIISLVLLILYFVKILSTEGLMKKLDYLYHFIGGALLLIAAIICLIMMVKDLAQQGCGDNCGDYAVPILATILGIITGLEYIYIGEIGWKGK